NATSFDVMARDRGGPHFSPGFRWKVYVRPSAEMSPVLVARSGTIVSPAAPRTCLYVTRLRSSSCENSPNAVPRYSPVGSNAPVKPKSSMAVRYTPPLVRVVGAVDPDVPELGVVVVVVFPPQAAATRARTHTKASVAAGRRVAPRAGESPAPAFVVCARRRCLL